MQKVAFNIDSAYVEKVLEAIPHDKYDDLVWAARKPPLEADEDTWQQYWNEDGRSTPIEIKTECLKQLKRVIATYPEEMEALKSSERGDWEHGFNSGCLAMIRWFEQAFDNKLHPPEATGEPDSMCFGGIDKANENFPFLDT